MDRTGQVVSNQKCPNDAHVVSALVRVHGDDIHGAIEACTGAAALADELAGKCGWDVSLAHPGYVNRMKQSPDKSDFSDAKMLADLLRVGYLPKVWLAPEEIRQLRALTRYRQQLVNDRRAVKLRICALLREARVRPPGVRRWGPSWMRWLAAAEGLGPQSRWVIDQHCRNLNHLDVTILDVERRLLEFTADDPVVARLLAIRGVGLVTAWVVRAEVGRFERFRTGKQLSRFIGLSPRNASSGQRQADAGLVKAGNEYLRATIIETAHRLIRLDPRWKELASSLRTAGKPACVVAAAIGNRWLRWLYRQMQGGSGSPQSAA
jgi:transposase